MKRLRLPSPTGTVGEKEEREAMTTEPYGTGERRERKDRRPLDTRLTFS